MLPNPVPDWRTADPTSPVVAAILAEPGHGHPPDGFQVVEPEGRAVLYDFCLMPYASLANPYPRLQTQNLLRWSFDRMGVGTEGAGVIANLQRILGPQCTVWGVKHRPDQDDLWWEFYFYRRDHVPSALSLDLVRPAFPMPIDARPPADVAWTFFSVELTVEHLRAGKPAHVRLYQEGLDLSWKVQGDAVELENHYRHFEVDGEIVPLVQALQSSVHAPRHPLTLARLLPPQLLPAWRIWLARKRRADTVYFQRVSVAQVAWMCKRHAWPADFCQALDGAAPYLQHALFDLGVDFARGEPPAAGEPPLVFGKAGIYASF